jgi:MFS family permease
MGLSRSFQRRYWLCMTVDAVGYGIYLPLSLIYFHRVTGLSLTRVGFVITVASLLALVSTPLTGSLVDRYGARTVLLGGYLVRAAGFGGYALVRNQTEMLLAATVAAFGTTSFSSAIPAFVSEIAKGPSRDKLIAVQRSVRNAGLGAGALAASAIISLHSLAAYHSIVLCSSAAFLAAALLVAGLPSPGPVARRGGPRKRGGYRAVIRNRPFLLLTLATAPVALGYMTLSVSLPVYMIQVLHVVPSWAGVMYAINTAGIALLQLPVTRLVVKHRRTRACALGEMLFALAFILYAAASMLPGTGAVLGGLVVATIVFTFAELLHGATSSALSASAAPEELRGRHLAFFQFAWTIPIAVAPAVLTALVALSPYALWLVLAAGVTGSALLLVFRLEPRLPAEAVYPAAVTPQVPPEVQKARSAA